MFRTSVTTVKREAVKLYNYRRKLLLFIMEQAEQKVKVKGHKVSLIALRIRVPRGL